MMSGLLTVGIFFNIYYQYSMEKDYLSEFADRGKAMETLESGTDLAVLDSEDTSVYRYDQLDALSCENSSIPVCALWILLAGGKCGKKRKNI